MLKKILLFSSLIYTALSTQAIEETSLKARFMSELVPSMQQSYQRGSFSGVDGIKINYYYRLQANPRGVIVVTPGQSESSLKYAELLYDLKDSGYAIYIIDHRGQGESGRMLSDSTKSYVRSFQDYVDDFNTFVKTIVHPEHYKKSFILAHSMGGAIASGFLAHNPKAVSAVILSAPVMKINTGRFGTLGADIVANFLKFIGHETDLAPTQKPYDPNERFEGNTVTSSPMRFQAEKDLYNKYPQLRVGGATVNWVKESLEYTTWLRYTPDLYQVPTLMLQAGRDQLVMPSGENLSCEVLSPDFCKLVKIENSQHEILMEQDSIRTNALHQIQAFMAQVESQ